MYFIRSAWIVIINHVTIIYYVSEKLCARENPGDTEEFFLPPHPSLSSLEDMRESRGEISWAGMLIHQSYNTTRILKLTLRHQYASKYR
jgi:hypothetical protein